MSISISSFGSIPMPTSLLPAGGTWLGGLDVFTFDPLNTQYIYAGSEYKDASGNVFSLLSRLNKNTNSTDWTVQVGSGVGASDYLTHAITDGTSVYCARREGTNAVIEKRNCSDGSLVSTSATWTNGQGAWNPGLMRMATIASVQYVALAGNTTGLFVVKASDMSTALDIADVTGGISPWFMTRMSFDNAGNLWLGSDDGSSIYSDLDTLTITNVAVSGGTITITMSGNFTTSPSGKFKLSGLTTKTYLNGQVYVGSGTAGTPTFTITGTGLPDDPSAADTGTVKLYPGTNLVKVTVPGGVSTVYNSVWPEAPYAQAGNLADTPEMQWFDSVDNTLVIGDENRPWRKISLATNPPSQSQVMEAVDYPNNLYQCEFTNFVKSANREGFTGGSKYVAITGLGDHAGNAYSFLMTIDDLLSNVIVFGQTAPVVGGALFNAGGYWSVDPSATNLQDVIADPNNNTTSGLRLWTLQPSGTATRWEWFDIAISSGGPNCTLSGSWKYPNGTPVANGKLYLRLSQDAQITGGGGQIGGGAALVITLDANGNVPAGTLVYSNDNLTPSGTTYKCSVVAPGGALVWGLEKVTITGAAYNLTAFVPPLPQDAGQP